MNHQTFSLDEIALARRLRDAGLPWTPAVGHYVYDERGIIEAPSPFQERVYFILDLKHFLRRSETIDGLIRAMFWLPDWRQTRALLRARGVPDETVISHLSRERAMEQGAELIALYRLLLAKLEG